MSAALSDELFGNRGGLRATLGSEDVERYRISEYREADRADGVGAEPPLPFRASSPNVRSPGAQRPTAPRRTHDCGQLVAGRPERLAVAAEIA